MDSGIKGEFREIKSPAQVSESRLNIKCRMIFYLSLEMAVRSEKSIIRVLKDTFQSELPAGASGGEYWFFLVIFGV